MSGNEGAKKHREGKEGSEGDEKVGIEAGDLVLAEFDGWMQENDELFDTTDESLAKEKGIHDEEMVYGPQPLIVGKGRLFPGLDEHMLKAEIGKEYDVVIPPDKAAGPRDPKLVELHPMREFLKQDIEPQVGMEVTVRNRRATIVAMTAGRVRIDFNNKLAGRTLKYRYKVVSKPTEPEEIVRHLLKMSYGTYEGFEIEHHGKDYRIVLPDACKYDQKWLLAKYRVVTDLREVLDADKVSFVEEYVKAKEEPAAEAAEEAKADEKPEAEKPEEPKPEEKAQEELSEEDRKE